MDLEPASVIHAVDAKALRTLPMAAVVGIACGAGRSPLVGIAAAIVSVLMLALLGFAEGRWPGKAYRAGDRP